MWWSETKTGRLQPQAAPAKLHNSEEPLRLVCAVVVSFPWVGGYQSSVGVHSKVPKLNLAMLLPLSFPVNVIGWMTVEKVLWDHLTKPYEAAEDEDRQWG